MAGESEEVERALIRWREYLARKEPPAPADALCDADVVLLMHGAWGPILDGLTRALDASHDPFQAGDRNRAWNISQRYWPVSAETGLEVESLAAKHRPILLDAARNPDGVGVPELACLPREWIEQETSTLS